MSFGPNQELQIFPTFLNITSGIIRMGSWMLLNHE